MTDGAGVTTTGAGVSTGMGRNEDTTVGAGVVTGLDIGSGVVGFGEGAGVVGLGDGSAVGFRVGRLVCRVGGGVGLGDGGWLGCLLGGSVPRRARSEVMSGRSSTAMLFVDDGWIVYDCINSLQILNYSLNVMTLWSRHVCWNLRTRHGGACSLSSCVGEDDHGSAMRDASKGLRYHRLCSLGGMGEEGCAAAAVLARRW